MFVAPLNNRKIIQLAFVVNDLESAADSYMETLDVGPFYITDRPKIADATYRGESSQFEFSTAITQAGDVQLELVQQHCDNLSCYRDTIQKGTEGFHHIAVFAEDYDAEMARYEKLGIVAASAGRMGPMRFAYMDTSRQIHAMTEVLESTTFIHDYFGNLKKACEAWDGSRPIRSSSELF